MFCRYCGEEQNPEAAFCTNCGKPIPAPKGVEEPVQPVVAEDPVQTPVAEESAPPVQERIVEVLPKKNEPLSPWGYFGLQILFAIPVIGFIFLIIFSCSGSNINRRNFARSYWCSLIIVAVVLLVVLLLAVISGGLIFGSEYMRI